MTAIKNQIRCYFSITGFYEPPDFFTNLLGIKPSDFGKKGEPRQSHVKHGSYFIKDNFWRLDSDRIDSYDIADYVSNIISKLKSITAEAKRYLSSAPPNTECNIIVAITIHPESTLPGMILKPDLMSFMYDHSINLVIDMN